MGGDPSGDRKKSGFRSRCKEKRQERNPVETAGGEANLATVMKGLRNFLLLALATGLVACTPSGEDASTNSASAASATGSSFRETAQADRESSSIVPYPFKTCAVQWHKPFKDGKPKHRRVYQGHEVLFCCTPCVRAFDMNPDPYMPRIVAAAAARDGGG